MFIAPFVLLISPLTPFLLLSSGYVTSSLAFFTCYIQERELRKKWVNPLTGIVSDLSREPSRFSEPESLASSSTALMVFSFSTTSSSMTGRKGGTITVVNSPSPTSTVGRAYHGFLLAWDKSECAPEGHASQGRVHIEPHAPAGRRGPLHLSILHRGNLF